QMGFAMSRQRMTALPVTGSRTPISSGDSRKLDIGERAGARIATLGGDDEAGEGGVPAPNVEAAGGLGGEAAVAQAQDGRGAVGDEGDLDGRRSRRHHGLFIEQ